MKSNLITRMITVCMCMVVVSFASNVKTITKSPEYQKKLEVKQLWQENQNAETQSSDLENEFNSKEEYYNYLASQHGGSSIDNWTDSDYTSELSAKKAEVFGTSFYVPGERDSDHTIEVCVDYWASEGSWDLYSYATGWVLGTQYFSAGYECQLHTLTLAPGSYSVDSWDSYGDGGQSVYVDGTYLGSSSGSYSWIDFDLSDPDDGGGGNCELTMNDSYGDGWNGNEWCSGGLCAGLSSGSSGTASFDFDTSAANDWTCGGGSYASEVSWSLSCDGSEVASGGVGDGCFGNCAAGCADGEFTCNDGSCIPGSWECDVSWCDCPGGACEDEADCGSAECADCAYDWTPYGSECCDTAAGEYGLDCATLEGTYGWDCSGCECPLDGAGCSESQWTCDDGSCIPASYYCDGSSEWGNAGWGPDCGDGSDENFDNCCAAGEYADELCNPPSYCEDDAACNTGAEGACEYADSGYNCDGSCADGYENDCSGACASSSTIAGWQGDGWCDDGAYGLYLNCCDFNMDDGDCGAAIGCDGVASDCGGASEDECGVCGGDGIADGACDCAGNTDAGCGCGEAGPSGCDNACGSTLENDACGVCGGDGSDDQGCGCFEAGPSGCDNACGSTAADDECGVCGGDNSSCADCAGVPNGDSTVDGCGTCDNDASNDCPQDCMGTFGGDADYDCSGDCVAGWLFGYLGDGWCDGSDAPWGIDLSCYDCDNGDCSGACGCEDDSSCNDDCGVPNGDGSSCADCAGTPNGDAELDYCGVCDGGNEANDCDDGGDDGCLTVSMTDAYGDGWNGNVLTIGDESFTLESGAEGSGEYCGPSDVAVTCGGGSWGSEVSWSISDGSGELLSGGAPYDGCLGTCEDDGGGECVNDDSTSDAYGDTCSSWYDSSESPGSYGCTGGYDDDDFVAADQCCACQGAASPGDDDVVYSSHAGEKLAEAKENYIAQQHRLDNPIATPDVSRDDCGGTGPDVGCDGVCFSGLAVDECGDCGGGGLNGDGCCYDIAADCAGECGGGAFTDCMDQCAGAGYAGWVGDGYCDDGTYGLYFDCDEFDCDAGDCLDDCGDCSGGNAAMDDCGECDGDNSSCADCAGTPYGDAVDDCSGDGDCFSAGWVGDGYCDGADQAWGADLICYDCDGGDCIDECGVCDGSGIADGDCDCDGNTDDCCGECGGDNSTCGGSGDINGGGVDVTDVVAMVGDILGTATLDDCSALEADMNSDGSLNVMDVIAAVEVILSDQTGGCTDDAANNYNPDADFEDGSCTYDPPTCADQGLWDCGDGQCIPTSYVCDGSNEFCNAGWGPDCANGADEGLDACGYTDDCVAGACDSCEFDFTNYGSECCDTAWDAFGISCAALEANYNWDCSGCACPGDEAGEVCGNGYCAGDETPENCPDDCTAIPDGWTCSDGYYTDTWCDCGCGAYDPVCDDETANQWDNCGAEGCVDPTSPDCNEAGGDDGGSEACADCEYDWTNYGAECCDTAWDSFGIDCATLEANYGWDCSGCGCPGDDAGDDGGEAGPCDNVPYPTWAGDGYCDGSNNIADCYDGGDCCPSTCVDGTYDCASYGGECADCIDPSAEDANGGGSCADAPDPTCADTDCGYYMSIGYTCYELLGYGYDCSLCEAEGADCAAPEGCSDSQWECADGQCISGGYYCDGSAENGNAGWGPDCGDGSDEVLEECCANGSYDDATCGGGDDGGGGGGNCELTMNDSYGDGWNGNEWCSGGQCAGLTGGASGTASFDFDLSAENCYTCGGGSWGSEVSWSLSCDGAEVASGGTGEGCFGGSRSADEVSDSDLKLKMVATHGNIVPERNTSLGLIGHVTDLNATKADKVKPMVTKSIVKHNAKKPADVFEYEAPLGRKASGFESKLQRAESVKLIQTAEGLRHEADGFVGYEITLKHGSDFTINVTESAFIADYATTGNTTKVIVVGPETENLFSSTDDYEIVDVIAGTAGGTALSADIVLVTEFGLSSAYPNPFNPSTSFELGIPADGFVSVKVYNIMGQVVTTLHEGNLTVNNYSFTWDAVNAASGMYFVKAETAGNVDVQKIMLMK